MTWLVGTSTWGSIVNDICKLACAEMTDSLGHAPTVAEKWIRDIDTGHNLLRMPASQDIDLAAVHQPAMRAGYWNLASNPGVTSGTAPNPPGSNPLASVCKTVVAPTAITSSMGRMVYTVSVATANTTAGDYSTARFTISLVDPDHTANGNSFGSVAPTAAGLLSFFNGFFTGSLQVSVTDPSGFLQVGATWVRGFSSSYLWGVDSWPMYPRTSGPWTFATAPPGVAGTDYDVINWSAPTVGAGGMNDTHFAGLGCKTATGANGARYVLSACPVTPMKVALAPNVTAGFIDLNVFGISLDPINGNQLRANGGMALTQWLRLAQSTAQVTNAMTVQYWMSVTATGIVIVLNSDPGLTGGMTDGYFGLVTPGSVYDANDKFATFVSPPTGSLWLAANLMEQAGLGNGDIPYFRQYRCQDGSAAAVRDWQTYWMRSDFGVNGAYYYPIGGYGLSLADWFSNAGGSHQGDDRQGSPYDTVKPSYDGNWWLYGYRLVEGGASPSSGTISSITEAQTWPRGAINDRFWHLPGIGWANGDELTDTVTGTKYLCVMPDSPGLPGRMNCGTGAWRGGTAIAEL